MTLGDAEYGLRVGDPVEKIGGDYVFAGRIVARFKKLGGQPRFVVENGDGILHIFSGGNLRYAGEAKGLTWCP